MHERSLYEFNTISAIKLTINQGMVHLTTGRSRVETGLFPRVPWPLKLRFKFWYKAKGLQLVNPSPAVAVPTRLWVQSEIQYSLHLATYSSKQTPFFVKNRSAVWLTQHNQLLTSLGKRVYV